MILTLTEGGTLIHPPGKGLKPSCSSIASIELTYVDIILAGGPTRLAAILADRYLSHMQPDITPTTPARLVKHTLALAVEEDSMVPDLDAASPVRTIDKILKR